MNTVWAFVAGGVVAGLTHAQVPDSTAAEIHALLDVIAGAGCEFQRNGEWHDGTKARQHLGRKYAHMLRMKPTMTTEEFIASAATSSSMSGTLYLVRCVGESTLAAKWLAAELSKLRAVRP